MAGQGTRREREVTQPRIEGELNDDQAIAVVHVKGPRTVARLESYANALQCPIFNAQGFFLHDVRLRCVSVLRPTRAGF